MKYTTLFALATMLFCTACTVENDGPEIIIDPVKKTALLAVVNLSGKSNIPTEIQIDGLYDSKSSIGVGNIDREAPYEVINAGLRQLALGSYKDTLRLQEHNYYTLMIYDNDSLRLSLDAPFSANQFNTMPQVRWMLTGADPQDYAVHITADSTLRNIAMGEFTSVNHQKETKLSLYPRNNIGTLLGETKINIALNKKATINIRFDEQSGQYDFEHITQSVK